MHMEKIYTLVFLPFFLLVISCSLDSIGEHFEDTERNLEFRESRAEWRKLKKKNGNSYEYTILEESWTGVGSETTIHVQKGKVIGRYYVAFIISEEDGSKEITETYEETSRKEIGNHAAGAPPYTMDDLYRTCLTDYLRLDDDTNVIYFETNEEGVMNLCGFVPVGCQDDCFRGIRISSFSWK